MKIILTNFVLRQFEPGFVGTNLSGLEPKIFEDDINYEINLNPEGLVDGYAPFCKHFFTLNTYNSVSSGVMEITLSNQRFLMSGYIARREGELPVLSRWLDLDGAHEVYISTAKYLDIILYDAEQLAKEGDPIDGQYGIVSINGVPTKEESPMPPATMVRNALGIDEGGSGVPLDKEAYMKSVEYWNKYAVLTRSGTE